MQDWLGNELSIGDPILYSSASSNIGMNLGELLFADENKIQIRLWKISKRSSGRSVMHYDVGKIVTLQRYTGAYRTVTRYFGNLPAKEIDE